MSLSVLQPHSEPEATSGSAEWCEIGQHGPRQTVVPVPQAIASSLRVALRITFRNKIPAPRVLRRLELEMHQVSGEIQASLSAVAWAEENGCQRIEVRYDYEGVGKWPDRAWKTNKKGTKRYAG
jgi:hypothetical protein